MKSLRAPLSVDRAIELPDCQVGLYVRSNLMQKCDLQFDYTDNHSASVVNV